MIKVYVDGEYEEMTEKEYENRNKTIAQIDESKDNLTTLAEGLSTANNMKDVQEAAKNILESEGR